jgi:hypothetical protein
MDKVQEKKNCYYMLYTIVKTLYCFTLKVIQIGERFS